MARGYYRTVPSLGHEFRRKVRTVVRGITVLIGAREILNPFRYGLFTVQVISHKLLNWLVPLFLLLAALANLVLLRQSPVYQIAGLLQLTFYASAVLGLTVRCLNAWIPIRVASFLLMSNCSIPVAWIKYLKGERIVLWEPSKRHR